MCTESKLIFIKRKLSYFRQNKSQVQLMMFYFDSLDVYFYNNCINTINLFLMKMLF